MKKGRHEINCRLIGGGFGESILVELGGVVRFAIDSNKHLFNTNGKNETIVSSFFKGKAIDSYILTHYHLDHFQRFTKLVEYIGGISKIYYPDYLTVKDFELLVGQDTFKNSKDIIDEKDALSEFEEIKKFITNSDPIGVPFSAGNIEILKGSIIDHANKVIEYSVTMYGMSILESEKLRRKSLQSLISDKKSSSSGKIINSTSLIVKVDYGKFQALFLADAPLDRINEVLDQIPNLKPDLIKLAHHGSETSNSKSLINRLLCDKEQHAIISPYSRSNLPRVNVVKEFNDAGFSVEISNEFSLDIKLAESIKMVINSPTENYDIKKAVRNSTCYIDSYFAEDVII